MAVDAQVELPGDQAQHGDEGGADPQRGVVGGLGVLQADVHPATEEGADGVRFAVAEDHRHFVADDVAQHAAEDAGDHSHHRGDEQRHAGRLRLRYTGHGEQAEADGVGDDDQAFGEDLAQRAHQRRGDQRQHEDEDGVFLVHDPEQRPAVEQDVAQGAAAEGGDEGDREHADQVHALAARLDEAGEGADQDSHDFDDGDQGNVDGDGLHVGCGRIGNGRRLT